MEFKGGTYMGEAQIDVSGALKDAFKLDEALRKIGTTLSSISKGHDMSAFWDEQAASIENVISALDRYKEDVESIDAAEALAKSLNAFAAWHPDDSITRYLDRLGDGAQDLINKAKTMASSLDSAFSVPSLRSSIEAFNMLRDAGVDVNEIVSKLKQGDLSALTDQIHTLEKESGKSASTINSLKEQLDGFRSGSKFAEMRNELNQFRESAQDGVREFRAFLEAAGFEGVDTASWGRFSNLFTDIETGAKTASQAIQAVREAYSDMFSDGATSGQIDSINASLSEMKQMISDIGSGSGGGGFIGGGSGDGGAGSYDDKLREIIGHLERINEQLVQVSSALGSFGGKGAEGLTSIISSMQDLLSVVNELSKKDFSVQNIFQSGDAEINAANGLRAYREEAVALNTYLTTLRNTIVDTGNANRQTFGRVLLQMREQLDVLGDFDPEKIKKQIMNAKDLGALDSVIVQLNEYRNAMQQIVDVGKQVGVEFPLPDTAGLDAARQKVAELSHTVETENTAMSEAATSAEQLSNALSISERGLSSASAEQLAAAFETLKTTLETIRGQIDAAFDLTKQLADVQTLSDAYQRLGAQLATVNQNVTTQSSGVEGGGNTVVQVAELQRQVSELLVQLNEALGNISKAFDLSGAISGAQEFKNQLSEILASITALQQSATDVTDRFKSVTIDSTMADSVAAVAKKFSEIGDLLSDLRVQIAETFNLGPAIEQAERLSQAYSEVRGALELIRDLARSAQHQISSGAGGSDNALDSARASVEATTDAIEKQTQAWYDDQAAWREAQDQMAREDGWAQAAALAKREAAEQAAIERDIAAHRKAEESKASAATSASEKAAAAWDKQVEKYRRAIESLQLGSANIKFGDNADAVGKYSAAIDSARAALDAVRESTVENRDTAIDAFNQEIASVRALREELNGMYGNMATNKQLEAFKRQWINFTNSNTSWYKENKAQYDEIWAKISSGAQMSSQDLQLLQTNFMSMNNAMAIARAGGKSFFDEMKAGWRKFGGWSIVTRSFTAMIRVMKQAVSAVKEVDAAMVELRKVTQLTEQQYKDFFDSVADSSSRIGTSMSDMINATADFARLGYEINDATKLAEAASIYMNVGDKIESMDDATSSIISTMKAFGIEAEHALTIVDKYNEVGKELLPMPVVTRCLVECYIGQSSIALCA